MKLLLLLLGLFPLFVEYTIAGKVYTVHDYRRLNVNRDTATVRRIGNTYVFPRYSSSSVSARSRVRGCTYGGYQRLCCAGWSKNEDGSCSPICTMNCVHGKCVAPDMCKCEKGYTGKSCNRDLNECGLEPRPCDHRCTNTQGSFRCFCERGFVLMQDGQTCARDERCYPGRCSHGCTVNMMDVVTCICPPGLRLIEDGYHCKDIDECAEGLVTCPEDQECRNTFGNYLCVCKEGYQFQYIDGKYRCVAAGCESLGYECHQNAYCGYIDLRPECICNEGFWGNGRICLPATIRDCSDRPCFPGVVCTNAFEDVREVSGYPPEGIFDQFRCGRCPRGYRGDGINCTDINECEEGRFDCDENAECVNEPGSYRCECLDGYHGNGDICVEIAPLTCDDCFPGVDCSPLALPNPNNVPLLRTLDFVYLFECGPCPPGLESIGLHCEDINECERGTDDCSIIAECVNDYGSYHCECRDNYHGNGEICVPVSPITCDDEPCYPGVECFDVPLPDANDTALLRTYDIIELYECGPCPEGYEGDGETCSDINECEIRPPVTDCSVNATCENLPGDYMCVCSDGFFGNGTHCSILNPFTCDDDPCSPFAECFPIDLEDLNFLLTYVQQFECGPCLEGYIGDGYNCTEEPKEILVPFVDLTVIVVDNENEYGDPLQPAALVKVLVRDPRTPSGTRTVSRGRTGDDGMVRLDCPHDESIIITAYTRNMNVPVSLFSNSVTFRCNFDQTNVVTLPLHRPYEDTIYVYHPESTRNFGIGNETLNERYTTYFPEDSFDIPDNRKVQLLFRSVNVSVPEELEMAPEMIACIPKPTLVSGRGDVGSIQQDGLDTDIRAIETFGAVELTVGDLVNSRAPQFKPERVMTLTFPIQKLPSDLQVGDNVPAWTFDLPNGCWNKDGEGTLVIDEVTGNLVWRYQANHFSWWAAGRVNSKTSCVSVRTCHDEDCRRPAPDTLIGMFGQDYGFETFRYTNLRGRACIQFPFGRTLEISSPCSRAIVTVESTVRPSSCPQGNVDIPSVPEDQLDSAQDQCRTVTLVVPESDRFCPDPPFQHNNLLNDYSYLDVRRYNYSDTAKYSCKINGDAITGDGAGYRHCTRCYEWSGDLECEEGGDDGGSSFY